MTTFTAVEMMVAAGVLGVTHGIEPDHVAGISALTNGTGDSRLSAALGACFAVGHVLLVVAWVVGAIFLLGVTSFPPLFETVGLSVVGGTLVLLSGTLGLSAFRRLVHRHEHDHSRGTHAHFHLHLPGTRRADHADREHDHEHTLFEYLKIGLVGALFTMSPPLSMIVFVSVVVANAPGPLVASVVLAYAVAITLTMSSIGYGAGAVFGLAEERGDRIHAALQMAVAGVILVVAVRILVANLPGLLAP